MWMLHCDVMDLHTISRLFYWTFFFFFLFSYLRRDTFVTLLMLRP